MQQKPRQHHKDISIVDMMTGDDRRRTYENRSKSRSKSRAETDAKCISAPVEKIVTITPKQETIIPHTPISEMIRENVTRIEI